MAKITWLGEADGPAETIWNGVTFPAGVPVETDNPYFARKAVGNPFFMVEHEAAPVPEQDGELKPVDLPALVAVHRGRGSWSIMRGAAEVQSGLSKPDAEAFNSLADAEKEAFVADAAPEAPAS